MYFGLLAAGYDFERNEWVLWADCLKTHCFSKASSCLWELSLPLIQNHCLTRSDISHTALGIVHKEACICSRVAWQLYSYQHHLYLIHVIASMKPISNHVIWRLPAFENTYLNHIHWSKNGLKFRDHAQAYWKVITAPKTIKAVGYKIAQRYLSKWKIKAGLNI